MRYFLDNFAVNGFVQIGKSMAVNLYKVDQVKTDLNMRLKLLMDNGEILILNRNTPHNQEKRNFLHKIVNKVNKSLKISYNL